MTLNVSPDAFLLRQIGEVLFGSSWQADLAEVVGVSDRSLRRWAAGEGNIPPGVWRDIWSHAENQRALIAYFNDEVLKRVEDAKLEPIPNASPMGDMWGLHFALQTGTGRPVRCFIAREVLDDRVLKTSYRGVLDYFQQHAETFYRVAQRKYLEGDIAANGLITITNADVECEHLPDVRRG